MLDIYCLTYLETNYMGTKAIFGQNEILLCKFDHGTVNQNAEASSLAKTAQLCSFQIMKRKNNLCKLLLLYVLFLANNSSKATETEKLKSEDLFECWKSETYIPVEKVCDGKVDCQDNEDESICPNIKNVTTEEDVEKHQRSIKAKNEKKCGIHKFRCKNGKCISKKKLCDGEFDCIDGSDEQNCSVKMGLMKSDCPSNTFHCNSEPSICLPVDLICDFERDCPNGEDEMHCEHECLENQFKCKNNRCIDKEFICNGMDDCGDGTDEESCMDHLLFEEYSNRLECKNFEYKCYMGPCIPTSVVCDGFRDCPNGDDEHKCPTFHICHENEFQCKDKLFCFPESWVCDGIADCRDKSDEIDCPNNDFLYDLCSSDSFICSDGSCIPREKMCDGSADCNDKSDEHIYCGACKTENGGCPNKCREGAFGVECQCGNTWRQASLFSSEDHCPKVDYCELHTDECDHFCHSNATNFSCSCSEGYDLEYNLRTCKLKHKHLGHLVFSIGHQIRSISINSKEYIGADYTILFDEECSKEKDNGRIMALDYNYKKKQILFSRKTSVYSLANNEEKCLFGEFLSFVNVAVDWVTSNIYFADEMLSRIGVCNEDGRYCTVFDKLSLRRPRGLATHPKYGYLFLCDWGANASIIRVAMDGQSWQVLHHKKLSWPNSVAVDYVRDMVYWMDAKYKLIERSRLDGSEREVVASKGVHHPFDMVVFDGRVFWSDWTAKSLLWVSIFNGSEEGSVQSVEFDPYGIAINHPVYQNQTLENPCAENDCSHLCTISPRDSPKGPLKHTCLCPSGYTMYNDKKQCHISPNSTRLHRTLKWCTSTFQENCEKGTACKNGGKCHMLYDAENHHTDIVCDCPKNHAGVSVAIAIVCSLIKFTKNHSQSSTYGNGVKFSMHPFNPALAEVQFLEKEPENTEEKIHLAAMQPCESSTEKCAFVNASYSPSSSNEQEEICSISDSQNSSFT
ncbi:Low-density lipoprotein receptor-related protein [Trichinella spiralis]|uniref:Low-density lipoprotein receptor-related protein n=1 Tax=Trichinella spiralis TaxID=6334 RepID=A0ABR3K3T2_TRISP